MPGLSGCPCGVGGKIAYILIPHPAIMLLPRGRERALRENKVGGPSQKLTVPHHTIITLTVSS